MQITPIKRFLLGGAGAILPVTISVVTLDIATYLSDGFSWSQIIGITIRYSLLFAVGGFITYLHDDENKPFKLVEIGVAAPALITSLVAGNAATGSGSQAEIHKKDTQSSFSIISSAYAGNDAQIELADNFFEEIFRGLTGSVYSRDKSEASQKYKELKSNVEKQYSVIVTPNNNVYEIKASALATGKSTPDGLEYKFSIYINSSKEGLSTIKDVQYTFNHPTFRNKQITVDNPNDQFLYNYTGWGCLTSVGVNVELKDGSSTKFNFNMCRSLGPEWTE